MESKKSKGLLHGIYIFLKNKFDPVPPVSEEEIYALEICKKLILLPSSQLTNSPISYKRYIKNDEKKMFVVLKDRTINIINHIYSYNVFIENVTSYGEICEIFDTEMERKRISLEEEIKSNIQHSLSGILSKLG